eukprot:7297058-Karenia_brevis.AAC.1
MITFKCTSALRLIALKRIRANCHCALFTHPEMAALKLITSWDQMAELKPITLNGRHSLRMSCMKKAIALKSSAC